MQTDDLLVRATAADGSIRAFVVDSTQLTREAQTRHNLYPVASAALGRTMVVGLVMGSMLKADENITIQIQSRGPLGGLVVSADSGGGVRGYVRNPQVELPLDEQGKLAVGAGIGPGTLHVIRDMGLKEPYTGTVALQTGEIGDDFAYYFSVSEQIPSVVAVGTLVNPDGTVAVCGGYCLQLLPGADPMLNQVLEERIPNVPPITTLLSNGKTPESILFQLIGDLNHKIFERRAIRYSCPCSRQRFRRGLLTLGREELEQLAAEEESLELICHFCREHYYLSRSDVEALIAEVAGNELGALEE